MQVPQPAIAACVILLHVKCSGASCVLQAVVLPGCQKQQQGLVACDQTFNANTFWGTLPADPYSGYLALPGQGHCSQSQVQVTSTPNTVVCCRLLYFAFIGVLP